MRAKLLVLLLCVSLVAAACGSDGADQATVAESPAPTEEPVTAAPTPVTAEPEEWQVVIMADSLAMESDWPKRWGELIEANADAVVEVLNHAEAGYVDYFEVIADPQVRGDLTEAEIIFISPEPDFLLRACEPGDVECRDQAVDDYRIEWNDLLDEIRAINPDALLRSAKAWLWLAPPDGGAGLVAFMDAAAEITEAHGGIVLDINTIVTGPDLSDRMPNDFVGQLGHFRTQGSIAVAEALHGLGYDA